MWRIEKAARVAFLVDACAYFDALVDACERAERSIVFTGWDFNSRVRLRRAASPDGDEGFELAAFLGQLLERKPTLEVFLLAWDFSAIYARERELLPVLRFAARGPRRLHFRLDDSHPFAGSQHQKLAVIDDSVAFCGGLDLTACRWDTPAHAPDDPRRVDVGFGAYTPFHDVQMVVDGDAAARLGELVRERWRRATGRRLRPPRVGAVADRWPSRVEPDARDVEVGIARTVPADLAHPAVREVEALYVDAIRAARARIYVENQYLTSSRVVEVLAERLEEADGPEVLIVTSRSCTGWLEESTMGLIRARRVRRLVSADRHGRLLLRHPRMPGEDACGITVHSKVLVVDERLVRVGSANLSNRSMGLDSECDLAVEARDARGEGAVAVLRDRLLAEHLGLAVEEVSAALRGGTSFAALLERADPHGRHLAPLPDESAEALDAWMPSSAVIDPDEPVDYGFVARHLLAGGARRPQPRRLRAISALLLVIALVALWWGSPLASYARTGTLTTRALAQWTAFPAAFAGFALLAVAGAPVWPLTLVSAVVVGGGAGLAVSILGGASAALGGYAFGRWARRDWIRALAGRYLVLHGGMLGRARSARAVAALHLSPRIPFARLNVAAGWARAPVGPYLGGTGLAIVPTSVAIALLGAGIRGAWVAGVGWAVVELVVGAWLVAVALLGLHGVLTGHRARWR